MNRTEHEQLDKSIKVLIDIRLALTGVQRKLEHGTEPHEDLNQILGSVDWCYTNLSTIRG